MALTVTTPDFTGVVDQSFFIAPLGGPLNPINYLDRFPDEVYNKSLDSHLVKFVYAILGPAGIGWLRKNYLQARLVFEDYGLDNFDLDAFYGDPFSFARVLEEMYDEDPGGLLPRDQWEAIKAKDASYRNRAIDFLGAARAGTTLEGMHLAARSGLGHECEVVENYKALFDSHTDDPLGIPYQGSTLSTEEFIVIPRREAPQSEVQTLTITSFPTGGTFDLFYPVGDQNHNQALGVAYNIDNITLHTLLEGFASIGVGNIELRGGPLPGVPVDIHFTNKLANHDVAQLQINFHVTSYVGGTPIPTAYVTTQRAGIEYADEIAHISSRDQHHVIEALDKIKPVATIITFRPGRGTQAPQEWTEIFASSTYHEVIRYVTGQVNVAWPPLDSTHWIERNIEHEAQRSYDDLQYHYQGFHNVAAVIAYTEEAVSDPDYLTDNWLTVAPNYKNEQVGSFTQYQSMLFGPLATPLDPFSQFEAGRCLADYAEPLTVNATTPLNGVNIPSPLINGVYPVDYQALPGVPSIRYTDGQFWASKERPDGDDYLEIDLGTPQALNYLIFEATRKPYDIEISYDLLDLGPSRSWQTVTTDPFFSSTSAIGYQPGNQNPWEPVEVHFTAANGNIIFARYIRVKFARRLDANSPFITTDGTQLPFSIEVRNLRIGRNIS